MWKIAMSYVRGTVKDSAPKFGTFWLVLGIWRGDTGMIWRHRKVTSSSFGYNIIWGGGQSNFVWLAFCFLSEAGSCLNCCLIFFFSFWASSKLMFCCRTPNSRRATISYFGLIGNLLKREVEFWQFKGSRTHKSSSCAIYLWQKL